MLQNPNFSAPDPAAIAYNAPQTLADGEGQDEGLVAPSQKPHARSQAFRSRFYGSQGLTHYRVGNPMIYRFHM